GGGGVAGGVTAEAVVRGGAEAGRSELSRASRASGVSSPRAANAVAGARTPLRPDMPVDVAHLRGPAALVHLPRLGTAGLREAIEAGLDHGELRAAGHFLELELDERGGLGRIVPAELDRVGMPAVG